ncbi:PilW family protein [Candidatus Omnitrophota bacterium]
MNAKGTTLVEALISALVMVFVLAICLTTFITCRNVFIRSKTTIELQQRARISLDKILNELRLANSDSDYLKPCSTDCVGDIFGFQVPVVTGDLVAGTVFNQDGSIKWGADVAEGDYIFYLVPTASFIPEHADRLVRLCGPGETLHAAPNYAITPIADDTRIINFDNSTPGEIVVSLEVFNNSFLGYQTFEMEAKADVRNKP